MCSICRDMTTDKGFYLTIKRMPGGGVSFEDKQQVVDLMITVIRATSEKLQIEWKI